MSNPSTRFETRNFEAGNGPSGGRSPDGIPAGRFGRGSADSRSSDAAVIELLRLSSSLGISELAGAMGVTATAVRQRLDRLMQAGLVGRTVVGGTGDSRRRGRPSHRYSLTEKGRRRGGDNFRDLAMVLWSEVRGVKEPSVRQGLIGRIGSAMAGLYGDRISGATPRQRLESVAALFRDRQLACEVDPCPEQFSTGSSEDGTGSSGGGEGLSVLTAHTCPYPELAERDRGICAAERLMLQELVGASVQLTACRLDGDHCCRFTADNAS